MNFSKLFITRPVMTTLVMAALLFFGILAYKELPVSDLPDVDYPTITVSISYPGASPETMSNNVITPLEQSFLTISSLKTIVSTSTNGNATVVLQFALSKSLETAAQDVQAAINTATPNLPPDLPYAPSYSKVNPSQTPIVYFALTSETLPLYRMYDYAYSFIGERLSTLDGVAKVVVYGSPFAVRVQVNPQKLAAKKISLQEVAQAIRNHNVNIPTGTMYGDHKEFILDVSGQLNHAALYQSMIIKNDNGSIVRIGDVGNAIDSLFNDKQYFRYLTENQDISTVVFGVQTQPGVNTIQVINAINAILPKLQQSLPGSIELHRVFDKSEFIEEAVQDVQWTLLVAFSLVVFVIYLYLGKALDTLIPALALPLSIIGTFGVMFLLGYTIDILSLLAITLSIGFLVDDAIVVLENIARHVEMGKSPTEASLIGAKEIGFTVISMTLSLTSIFIPLLFMGGLLGKLFHEFAVVIATAVLISGFVSLTLTPMLCSFLIRPTASKEESQKSRIAKISYSLNHSLLLLYERSLTSVLRHPKKVMSCAFAGFLLTVVIFKMIPTDFLPPDDIGCIQLFAQGIEGTSTFQMTEYQKQLNEIVRKNKAIESICSIAGTPDDNKGIMFLRLKDFKERPSINQIIRELREEFEIVPGVQVALKPFPLIDLQVSTTTTKAPYQYTLQGLNTQDLYQAAQLMFDKIKNIPGLTQVSTDLEIQQPHLAMDILRDKADVLNVSPQNIENALSFAFGAINLSPINEPENQYYAILEVEPKFYKDPALLSQIYLLSSTNKLVPLNSVVKIKETVGPLNITRINGLPAVNIFFDLDRIPLGTALEKIEAVAKETLPATVSANVQGTANAFQSSFASLNLLLLITLFLVYIILGILYENFLHPITVMSTLPPAALGGLVTLLIFGFPLSLYAFVGLILLLGIVMKNGIILVDFATATLLEGKTPLEAITHACLNRFRPILMTTFSALMGAAPIALGMGGMTAQGRIPLGLVIVGGLLFSQLLTLYITPLTYLYLEQGREWLQKKGHPSNGRP